MIERFGYHGYLVAPRSQLEAHAQQWLAKQAADAEHNRDLANAL